MIKTYFLLPFASFCMAGVTTPALAQMPRISLSNLSPDKLLMFAMHNCLEKELGADGVQRAMDMGMNVNNQVIEQCNKGDKVKARQIVTYYSGTYEGEAALRCGKSLKNLTLSPAAQQIMGAYAPMVNDFTSGKVPEDVCTPLAQTRAAKAAPVSPVTSSSAIAAPANPAPTVSRTQAAPQGYNAAPAYSN